jgi:hypothetical protein
VRYAGKGEVFDMRSELTESYLWDTYWGLEYSLRDISRISGHSGRNILNTMRRYGIPRRPAHGAVRLGGQIKGFRIRDPALAERLGLTA